jgi:diguanylate cyclase (GGDEF)-like protein
MSPPYKHGALSDGQRARLSGLGSAVSAIRPHRARVDEFCRLVHDALGVGVAIVGRRTGRTVLLSARPETSAVLQDSLALEALDVAAVRLGLGVSVWKHAGQTWTLVGLSAAPQPVAILMLQGDWSPSARELTALVDDWVSWTGVRESSAISRATHRLATDLAGGRISLREVCQLVLRHLVAAVPSRLGAIAIASDQGYLSIAATVGYPLALVEALRIPPGVGVIGETYQNATPTRVVDAAEIHGRPRRSRYRTASYIAVPIVAAGEVLGVLCLTDKAGDGVYTEQDLSDVAILLTPVALALGRERAERQARLYAQAALVDPASRLFNRPHLEKRLEEELERAARQGTPVSLLMIDIDEFKAINDTFGHVAGDVVIRGVADVLKRSIRVFDICGRYGGEEFAVVMPGSNLSSAWTTAERIRRRIEAYEPDDQAFSHIRVTASIGVSESAHGATARETIELADKALYAAKRAGKNQVRKSSEIAIDSGKHAS